MQKKFEAVGIEPELVEMIDRDILSRIPNVKWEDIAGLEDAKRLLNEAVIVPMMIPDVFKGVVVCICLNDKQ